MSRKLYGFWRLELCFAHYLTLLPAYYWMSAQAGTLHHAPMFLGLFLSISAGRIPGAGCVRHDPPHLLKAYHYYSTINTIFMNPNIAIFKGQSVRPPFTSLSPAPRDSITLDFSWQMIILSLPLCMHPYMGLFPTPLCLWTFYFWQI